MIKKVSRISTFLLLLAVVAGQVYSLAAPARRVPGVQPGHLPMMGPHSDFFVPDHRPAPRSLTGIRAARFPTDSIATVTSAMKRCSVIRVKLDDPRVHVTTLVAQRFPHGHESFAAMIRRTRPTIAVTGTFFSTRSLQPVGDIVVNGHLIYQGLMGTALVIRPQNRALIQRVRWGHAMNWSGCQTVLACGPALVLGGRVDVRPAAEGFHDPDILASCRRIGVGLTAKHELLLVTTLNPVTFRQWGLVMYGLGCTEAMNLDAGASMAVYYRGRTLESPARRLTNLLAVRIDGAAEPSGEHSFDSHRLIR